MINVTSQLHCLETTRAETRFPHKASLLPSVNGQASRVVGILASDRVTGVDGDAGCAQGGDQSDSVNICWKG